MAINIITTANSRSSQLVDNDVNAYLYVAEGGYIISALGNFPAYYTRGGHSDITVAGQIICQQSYGIYCTASTTDSTAVGSNDVAVAASGLVRGTNGVWLDGTGNAVANDGSIVGTHGYGIYSGGTTTVNNNGYVTGSTYAIFAAGSLTCKNSGTLSGTVYSGEFGYVTNNGDILGSVTADKYLSLVNSGNISGSVNCYGYDDYYASIYNYGIIGGAISSNSQSSDFVQNSGSVASIATSGGGDTVRNDAGAVVSSYVSMGGAGSDADSFSNYGDVGGYVSMGNYDSTDGTDDSDTVTNAGRIGRYVATGGYATVDDDNLTNSGRIEGYVTMARSGGEGSDVDTLTNTGWIGGAVTMGDGNDTIDTSLGVIAGKVDLGAGNDIYSGGDAADRVTGGAGNDAIDLGAGNDVYFAGNRDGVDAIDAGDGVDTYDASAMTLALTIDLSAGTDASAGGGGDVLIDFENIVGGAGADTLTGSDGANRIDGSRGADKIDGGAGNDRLIGGIGADTITGGAGRDVMTGGAATGANESDKFVFGNGDSGTSAATRDVITDFTDHGSASAPFATGADLINLSAIDANTTAGGNQAFSFNATEGAAFSGTAGSLIWEQRDAFALVSGDTNGDGKADFTIQLNGDHALFASDFVL